MNSNPVVVLTFEWTLSASMNGFKRWISLNLINVLVHSNITFKIIKSIKRTKLTMIKSKNFHPKSGIFGSKYQTVWEWLLGKLVIVVKRKTLEMVLVHWCKWIQIMWPELVKICYGLTKIFCLNIDWPQ